MYKKIHILSFVFILSLVSISFGQDKNSVEKTILFDEFGKITACDFGARLDSLIIELQNRPNAKGYILIYRGTKDVLSDQSDRFLQQWIRKLKRYLESGRHNIDRIEIINAGFRDQDYFSNRVWIVPENGEIPKPTDVVPKPKTPTERAYLADRSWFNFNDVSFETLNNIVEEDSGLIEYNYTEVFDSEEEIDEENKKYIERQKYFISDSFISELEKNKTSNGIIFYFIDSEEYHLGNAQELLQKNVREYAEKYKVDISKIRIIYGGYQMRPKLEFWIVPQNAPDAIATPEKKKVQTK